VPVCGGVPIPRGELASADNVRLLDAEGKPIPCQVATTAFWPDGSIKWVLVDAVVPCPTAAGLTLEYGPGVTRPAVADAVKAEALGPGVKITGGGVQAKVARDGALLEDCRLGGEALVEAGKPMRLVVNTIRIPDGRSGQALPSNTYLCRDATATLDVGKIQIDELAIEAAGPIRATIRLRGHVLLEHFGSTLPKEVLDREPAGQMPFSLRLSFFRQCPVILGQHQIVFSGEPDCDFIARWSIELPGQAGPWGRVVLEPGVELDAPTTAGDGLAVAAQPSRICWAPTKTGFALIRQGWENRPCAITQQSDGSAWIDFWPQEAGVWDLRRYSRQWACGESGDTRKPQDMLRYAKWAARGAAKSHDFAICATPPQTGDGVKAKLAAALAGRAVLVAPPSWYGATEALGPMAPEQRAGAALADVDALTRRRLDYMLYCQDLFGWYGKEAYGFWQSRFGQVHRNDRWDCDYGRWGWGLNDGAGRVGHLLMVQYLRTLDRRYLAAGEAFCRINYDTAMVHTQQHLEGAAGGWWTVRGCCHRHDAQPFGCPYIGMRGSNPQGQRILHLLTGDPIIADGLEIVTDACFHYATDQKWRLGNSGGSDGEGTAACAMLWKYETTGQDKYRAACRTILEASKLVPPADTKMLGYGPDFGLFDAAGEYADLSGDAAFRQRVVQTARLGAADKNPENFLYVLAMAQRFTRDAALRDKLSATLAGLKAPERPGLAELPPKQWPGHAGYRTNEQNVNVAREVPAALAVLDAPAATAPAGAPAAVGGGAWPSPVAPAKPVPAEPPADWFRPGGAQTPDETVPPAAELLALAAPPGPGAGKTAAVQIAAGKAKWTMGQAICDAVDVGGAAPLAGPIVPYVVLAKPRAGDGRLVSDFRVLTGRIDRMVAADEGLYVATGLAGPATVVARIRSGLADGVRGVRVEMACRVPAGNGRIASWGLLAPLKVGRDGHAIQATAPGRFRLERCRLDQNDEQIPNWLTSEYNWGEGASLWPLWRTFGISVGPGAFYRIWKTNAADCSPTFCDQGSGTGQWLDVTDRGANPRWGLTVRLLRPAPAAADAGRQAIRADLAGGVLDVQFRDAAAGPLAEAQAEAGLAAAATFIFHDGWRPPLAKPELTAEQYERFLDDLDYGGNFGLLALRFCLSTTHMVSGRQWAQKVRDLGIEPREILYGMMFKDGLAAHCRKLGVAWDADDLEGSVRRVVEHYRRP
jgi:hypothetical protein